MKINEVEALVGISRKNIRFYEQEGLLSPARDRSNGYRDYGEAEIDALRKIKLLRKLGLPLSEIRELEHGPLTLGDALRRHQITLERERRSAEQSRALCEEMVDANEQLNTLDAGRWLGKMEELEREGTTFMDRQKRDIRGRLRGSIVATVIMSVLMLATIAIFIWAEMTDPIPVGIVILIELIPASVLVGTILALRQRIRELKGGEEDAAGKY